MNVLLVIADDRMTCQALRNAVPETDLLLFETTVEDARRRLVAIEADAVIIDDTRRLGQEALAHIVEAAPAVPVIMLSSRSDPESRASLTLAGARACVQKPIAAEAVRAAVARVTSHTEVTVEKPVPDLDALARSTVLSRHQAALRWLTRISSDFDDLDRLSRELVEAVIDIFDAARAAVLLESKGAVGIVASNGIAARVTECLRLSFASGLMRWFEENACLFDRAVNREAAAAVKEMHVIGARLAVPLIRDGCVCGAIVIGEKASGLEYGFEERELLTMMGRYASTTLDMAYQHQNSAGEQTRLDTILARVSSGVVTVLPDKTVSMINEQAERLLGLSAGDVIGQSVQKLGSGFADVVLRTLADAKPRLRQRVHDFATDATLELCVTPLGGQGVVVSFLDVPEQEVSREEIAYSPFWEYLASRVAQEVKNPMVAINTFAQLLPRKYDSVDFRESFERVVRKEVARINGVVETLFDFAREPKLMLQRADINETVRTVLRSFEEELRARAITIEAEWEPQPTEADIDPVHFPRAVANVLQNSIDAMPEGGKLKVTTKKEGDICQVVVLDTGPGIPEDQAAHVFMPFYSTKERGMGLGLPTAARIMQQHKGSLELTKTAEGRSAFSFSVPSARKDHEDDSSN